MKKEVTIIIAEDDMGHATLIEKNLKRAGISNNILHFKDGQETLNFLFRHGKGPRRKNNYPYLLLLDIKMPKVDGIEVLRQVKQDNELCKMMVIMLFPFLLFPYFYSYTISKNKFSFKLIEELNVD